jgi:hypothetical protein
MRQLLVIITLLVLAQGIFAQSTYVPYNRDYYNLVDRFGVKYANDFEFFQNTYKPLRRSYIADLLLIVNEDRENLNSRDLFNLDYLMNDNWYWTNAASSDSEKNAWDIFYVKKNDFYSHTEKNFSIHINPVFEFGGGKDTDNDLALFTNTRGIEAHGTIDDKIGFYTFLTETQTRLPQYVFDYIRGVPHAFPNEGFWKPFGEDAWDLTHARGYITFNLTKSIDVQTGYDKNFIGNGFRSMVLSDFSSPYLFLKINTRLGRFLYTNLFAELTEDIIFGNQDPGDGNYPTKFMAMHRLSVNFSKNVEVGVFETIIARKADINYFNPIIFYRAIEQQQGSPDNINLGLDFKVNIHNKYQVYGQAIIDEFLIGALLEGNGDWRNKFGIQLGAKYFDAFKISTLDLQAEYNVSRPYFYAYEDPALSYTNYRNPLSHPLGANFNEIVLTARYQPVNKLTLYSKIIRSNYGQDKNGLNYGGNLLLSTDDRIGNTGNTIGQGAETISTYLEITGTYMLKHNIFIDFRNTLRDFNSEIDSRDLNSFISTISLRWNIGKREHEF